MVDDSRNTNVHKLYRSNLESAKLAKYAEVDRYRKKPECERTWEERMSHALEHGMTRGNEVKLPSGKVDKVFLVLQTGFLKFEDGTEISPFKVTRVLGSDQA